MLFLHRYYVVLVCIVLIQFYSYLIFSVHENENDGLSIEMVCLSNQVHSVHENKNDDLPIEVVCLPNQMYKDKESRMRPFGNLQVSVLDGVEHYRFHDDDYDPEFGYNFLFIGNDLYNEPLSEDCKIYLPEQYYTKKSKLWCVKSDK